VPKLQSSLMISNFARQKTAEKPYLRENEEFRVFVLRGFVNRGKGLEIGRREEERKKTQTKTTKGKKRKITSSLPRLFLNRGFEVASIP
jgi:hypothetical protein